MADRRIGPAAPVDLALGHRVTLVIAAAGWGKSSLLRALSRAVPSVEVRRPAAGWTAFGLARALVDGIAPHLPAPAQVGLPASPTADSPTADHPDHADQAVAQLPPYPTADHPDHGDQAAAQLPPYPTADHPDHGDQAVAQLPPYPTAARPDHGDQAAALATSVCVAGAGVEEDTLLVLDDLDAAADESLLAFVEALILGLPPRLHLVLAARSQPALRLTRLRAAGEVAVLGTSDLALEPDDVADLGLDPAAAAAVGEVVTATGGWPLAVHLAAEVARRGAALDRAALVDHLLRPDAVLFDYLAEEVLAQLDDDDHDLLVLAAHVPELSVDLLAGIGRAALAPRLARLVAERIFLEPVAGRPGLGRATLVGREFLVRALPSPSAELLDDAVTVLLAAGDVDQALVLSTQLGDPVRTSATLAAVDRADLLVASQSLEAALELAERGGAHPRIDELRGDVAHRRGEWDEALRRYEQAAGRTGAATTALARKRAGILYLRGRLDDAEAMCSSVQLDGHDVAEEARLLAWRAVVRWARGDEKGCAEFVTPALERAERSGDDGALAAACTARAMLAALGGDLPTNARYYERALDHATRAGDVQQVIRIRTNRGSRLTEQGQYAEALEELDTAITLSELAGSDTFAGLAYNNRGEAHLALGHLDLALADLRRGHDIHARLASNRLLYPLNNMGFVQLLRGQRSEAVALFTEAIRIAGEHRDAQGLVPAYVGLANALDRDDPPAAAAAAQAAIDANHAMWMPHAYLAAGTVALHAGDRDTARSWAVRATDLARQRQDRPALAEALLLAAIAETPPSATLAEQASRLWRDLGHPIGEARAELVRARTMTGRLREAVVARAERVLQDAGAFGALADARLELGEGTSSPISIVTLGGFRVSRLGETVEAGEWGSRKARDLVKLLVARRGAPVVREEVTELLWPDEADRSARRLSVLLSTVRTVLDPGKLRPPEHYVAADHDTIWLVRDHVDIDVELFLAEAAEGRRMLADGDRAKARTFLGDAAARYFGEFCADDPYADWAAGVRALAKHTFVDTCFELAGLADADGEHSEAIRYWLRILEVDPFDEDAHLGLIRSLLRQRRHGEARRAHRHYCARMAELDLEPTPFPTLAPHA